MNESDTRHRFGYPAKWRARKRSQRSNAQPNAQPKGRIAIQAAVSIVADLDRLFAVGLERFGCLDIAVEAPRGSASFCGTSYRNVRKLVSRKQIFTRECT